MYAVVDVETTGGKYNEEGITEIAIFKYDGNKIVDQFISLINPERPIQPFVVQLTGINENMLRNAPKFYEVAKRIVEITEDCTLVAHNASFDYRMLSTEFNRLGFTFERATLCTVAFAKKLIPEQASYKLGRLVRSLGIPLSDRHRAAGDARATVKLLKLLLDKDVEKEIIKEVLRSKEADQVKRKFQHLVDTIFCVPAQDLSNESLTVKVPPRHQRHCLPQHRRLHLLLREEVLPVAQKGFNDPALLRHVRHHGHHVVVRSTNQGGAKYNCQIAHLHLIHYNE